MRISDRTRKLHPENAIDPNSADSTRKCNSPSGEERQTLHKGLGGEAVVHDTLAGLVGFEAEYSWEDPQNLLVMCAKCASHLRVLLARSQNASLDRHSPLPSADRNSRQARTNFLSKLLHGIECRRQFFGHKVKHKVAGSQFSVALNCGCNVCRASSG